ncbi:uncharacterized protein AKAW2_20857S [Aspergillus luchuensis]|uniref:Uncharacterized protein n=2 Tax=Aspergillus kawachii TaxID=1069201 RepID=A0A7R7W3X9_ASPKA|nr:uncharacterized protein AKAW2_20857S [Aspergillus luchuensis]OJZ92304.1 hypothetical protein ASPFODRAFT_39638 [Aspergillus luchuensis CBS 106.47]BCR95917.1 hypothetical protein AKAW2_20857S [Aspergillus luchuensis]BCS08449.1 hypothetical protein ALUC_20819S [Aspergillus luchuensis]GAA81896.1 similar to An01g07970 [Aspergillus luchuensis IFO 4308]
MHDHDTSSQSKPERGEYIALTEDESTEGLESPVPKRRKIFSLIFFTKPLVYAPLAIALAGAIAFFWMTHTKNHYTYTDCGVTPDEARARGCLFEPMQRAWIPPECYFPEATEDYDTFRDRQWYLDTMMTIDADVEKLEAGEVPVAYTRYWHDEHCTYLFRKLALAVDMGKDMINSKALDIEHSNHCALAIAKRLASSYNVSFVEADRSLTESHLGFERCLPLKTVVSPNKAVPVYPKGSKRN